MKKTAVILCILLSVLNIRAQNYLIDFAGSGDTNVVGSVKVENLTSGKFVTLNGTDVLHLTGLVGADAPDAGNSQLQIYPDPMTEQSILTFGTTEKGHAIIGITGLSGKYICQLGATLSPGIHSFMISGLSKGIYFVKVNGGGYCFSGKLISLSSCSNRPLVEYISTTRNFHEKMLKSASSTIVMHYTDGDQLLFKGSSGIYQTFFPDVPTCSKTITFNFAACTDIDNNHYAIVGIGSQTWMAENLNTGSRINGNLNQTNNGTIEKYCYADNPTNCLKYGGLYQWDELMQYVTIQGSKGVCPDGWHLPTDTEWTAMADYIGGSSIAGGKMKETGTTHWKFPNAGATNSSGFSALPGGTRKTDSSYSDHGYTANFWTSSLSNGSWAWYRILYYYYETVASTYSYINTNGFSCRCVMD